MLREHDRVILTQNLPKEGLQAGDVGVIVHVYRQGTAFEVEFLALDGNTLAVATVMDSQVRRVTARDVSHARTMGIPA
ncbi:MAG: DUF4926 domain-containing protein [Chloroflexi bacterium]|nr:DUF4926 domain-containing protein [Chloroflexota bacterium]